MVKIDFGNCYSKVQNSINTTDKIIIALIEEKERTKIIKSIIIFIIQ